MNRQDSPIDSIRVDDLFNHVGFTDIHVAVGGILKKKLARFAIAPCQPIFKGKAHNNWSQAYFI
jgi:hypothetical protein